MSEAGIRRAACVWFTASLAAALCSLTVPPAGAHDTTTSWTIVRVGAQDVELKVKVAAEAVWPFVQTVAPGVILEMERLDALRPAFADTALRMHALSLNGRALAARTGEGRVVEDYLEFRAVYARPEAGRLTLAAAYLANMSPEFTADVTVLDDSGRLLASRTLTRGAPLMEVALPEAGGSRGEPAAATRPPAYRFDFGPGPTGEGHTQVLPATTFSPARGHGFEPGADLVAVEGAGALPCGCLASRRPFLFSVAVPEGNYDVAVRLGGLDAAAATTVRAESRRLMLEAVATAAGEVATRTFTVNVRTPAITWPGQAGASDGARVALKERERGAMDWDGKLTLEFGGARPSVCGVEITPAPAAPTVFVAGDSTVMDQPREPYASWGQMVTRFLGPGVAVANHAESGESLKSFLASRRLEKITSQLRAGDYLFIQFGHNDQKPASPATYVEPRTAYEAYLRVFVAEARQHGATPVLLTPVQRRQFDPRGRIRNSHGDYPEAVRAVARAERVPLIDLDRASRALYEALGPEKAARAFAKGDDGTHHGDYGAYELARCVVEGIRRSRLALARSIAGAARFDPARPDPVEGFALAASAASAGPGPGAHLPTPANPSLPSLVLVGDSTVRNGQGDGGGGQWGWGDLLAPFFDTSRINVVNRAMGGLSSRTYRTYGYWDETIALVKPGDVVLMQLGHNDGGPVNDVARARGSLPGVGEETEEIFNLVTSRHEVVHTYGFYLRGFVAEVRARGATPIVCSPVPRKRWHGGRIERNRETYAGWAAEVAREAGVPFLDLGEIIARRYEELGPERVEPLFADEHTHTTRAGAELNAAAVVAGLKGLRDSPLAAFLSEKAAAVAAWQP